MPAVANIVLMDAQGTPVSHTFLPLGPDQNNVWWFEDQSASSPIGYWRIGLSLTRPGNVQAGAASGSNRVSRVKLSFYQPTLETLGTNAAGITPPPTVAYIERSNHEFILPERSLLQNRKDIRKMAMNLLADPQVVAMVESLQAIF